MKIYYSIFLNLPFLRTPIRAYFLVHWVLCMGAVCGLSKLDGQFSKRISLIILAVVLFLIENVPSRLPAAKADQIIFESEQLSGFLSRQEEGTVLHLPSEIFPDFPVKKNAFDMNVISREYLYSFMQTIYKKNSVNGSAGYFPEKRIELNEILKLKSRARFENMLELYNIKYVVMHRDLMLKDETPIADSLAQCPFLHMKMKIGNCYVFSRE